MENTNSFFKAASIGAFVYAAAMLLQEILLTYAPYPTTLDAQMIMRVGTLDKFRGGAILLAFIFVILAFLGVTLTKISIKPARSITGFVFCLIFVIVELCYRAVEIFTVNRKWVVAYFNESNDAIKQALLNKVTTFEDVTTGLYFIIITTHFIGSTLYGCITWKSRGLEKVVSILFFLNSIRLFIRLIGEYGNNPFFNGISDYIYAPIVISLYGILGLWLWRYKASA